MFGSVGKTGHNAIVSGKSGTVIAEPVLTFLFVIGTKESRHAVFVPPRFSDRPTRHPRSLGGILPRSEEHTSELQSLMRISYAVFCLKKKNINYIPAKIK